MQNEKKHKRLTARGSGAEAALKPTMKEGPPRQVAAALLKSTIWEDPCHAKARGSGPEEPLKPTMQEGPPGKELPKQLKPTMQEDLCQHQPHPQVAAITATKANQIGRPLR